MVFNIIRSKTVILFTNYRSIFTGSEGLQKIIYFKISEPLNLSTKIQKISAQNIIEQLRHSHSPNRKTTFEKFIMARRVRSTP